MKDCENTTMADVVKVPSGSKLGIGFSRAVRVERPGVRLGLRADRGGWWFIRLLPVT